MSLVLPRLLVGGAAEAEALLLGSSPPPAVPISAVLSMGCKLPFVPPSGAVAVRHVHLLDAASESLLDPLPECLAFLDAHYAAGGTVLVHCLAGQSRSVAVVCAWLMAGSSGLCLKHALSLLHERRPSNNVNPGFLFQLSLLDTYLRSVRGGGRGGAGCPGCRCGGAADGTPSPAAGAAYPAPTHPAPLHNPAAVAHFLRVAAAAATASGRMVTRAVEGAASYGTPWQTGRCWTARRVSRMR